MRRILIPAAIGVLSLALANPAHAQKGGGGGRPGGGAAHVGAGAAHVGGGAAHVGGGAAHVGGGPAHVGGGGVYGGVNRGGAYYRNTPNYRYGYPGIGIGIGLGYGYGYDYGPGYYNDPTPIYVPSIGPTLGPSSYYSNYPQDSGMFGNATAPANIAPPPVAPPPISVPQDEAYIRVLVPDGNAEVLLEGKTTDALGRDRLFSSPKLDPGSKYSYTVTASWLDQGHLVRQTREVPLTMGQVSIVDFRRPQRQAPQAQPPQPQPPPDDLPPAKFSPQPPL